MTVQYSLLSRQTLNVMVDYSIHRRQGRHERSTNKKTQTTMLIYLLKPSIQRILDMVMSTTWSLEASRSMQWWKISMEIHIGIIQRRVQRHVLNDMEALCLCLMAARSSKIGWLNYMALSTIVNAIDLDWSSNRHIHMMVCYLEVHGN